MYPLPTDNLMDSNEDIDKLLVHDELTENSVLQDDVLSTGNERTDNLLKEITSEEHPYKSAELFTVNPAELENEFQDNKTLDDLESSEKTAEVQDMFERDAEYQHDEEEDQFGDEAFKPASEGMKLELFFIIPLYRKIPIINTPPPPPPQKKE